MSCKSNTPFVVFPHFFTLMVSFRISSNVVKYSPVIPTDTLFFIVYHQKSFIIPKNWFAQLKFLRYPSCAITSTLVYINSGSKWWTHVSSPVTIRSKTKVSSWPHSSKKCFDASIRCSFWRSVSILGTHLALTFLMPRWSCRILKMVVSDNPTNAESCFFFKRPSYNTNFSTFSTMFVVVASIGGPGRVSYSIDSLPCLKGSYHL